VSVDAAEVAAIMDVVARDIILPRFGALPKSAVRQKSGPNDLVTEVDEAAEAALREALHKVRPDARFIGEESVAHDPNLEQELTKGGAFWIVDPLDGTRNYVAGAPDFGTIIALVEDGRAQAGWILAAPERSCLWAVRGKGARLDGAAFAPAAATQEKAMALRSIGWLAPAAQIEMRARLSAHFQSTAHHCSASAYRQLALGLADCKVSSRIHPWDHVAGVLILEELGGKAAYLEDSQPYKPAPSKDRALLASAPGRDWSAYAGLLREAPAR
jgi:fructose-1,6-bisphosphatase/inositol monophosphatase family enzyme